MISIPSSGFNFNLGIVYRHITADILESWSFKVKYTCPELGKDGLKTSPFIFTYVKFTSTSFFMANENCVTEYISLFDIEHIETDFSIMTYSVKRGFQYSFYSFIIATTLNIGLSWDNERRAIPQVWDQYDNLLPMISLLGLNKQHGTGVTYESLTSLVPLTILISMAYDVFKDKNKFYFSPVYEKKEFGRSMHVFSLKQLVRSKLDGIVFRLEKSKLGRKVIEWFR